MSNQRTCEFRIHEIILGVSELVATIDAVHCPKIENVLKRLTSVCLMQWVVSNAVDLTLNEGGQPLFRPRVRLCSLCVPITLNSCRREGLCPGRTQSMAIRQSRGDRPASPVCGHWKVVIALSDSEKEKILKAASDGPPHF